MTPLAFAPFGEEVTVSKINTDDKTKRHLESLGIIAGAAVTPITSQGGNIILTVKDARIALDRVLVQKIYTEPCGVPGSWHSHMHGHKHRHGKTHTHLHSHPHHAGTHHE